jgi:hypothetical protein
LMMMMIITKVRAGFTLGHWFKHFHLEDLL